MATDGDGIRLYDTVDDKFYRIISDGSPGSLLNNSVRTIFQDASGGMWFGHYPAGVSMLDDYASAFTIYRHRRYDETSLSSSDILSVVENDDGNLWVGTEKGLNFIDREKNRIKYYLHNPNNENSPAANPILSLCLDYQGDVWLGSWGGGVSRFSPSTQTFTHYYDEFELPKKSRSLRVWAIFQDSDKNLWFGSNIGLSRYSVTDKTFSHYSHDINRPESSIFSGPVRAIYEDRRGKLWVGGDSGLVQVNRKTGALSLFALEHQKGRSSSEVGFKHFFEDQHGILWLSTRASGVYRWDHAQQAFSRYTAKNGLADNVVGGGVEDSNGNLWFGTGRL